MYQRDYLMRIIQEMTTMLGQLLGLQQKKNTELLLEWDDLLDRRFRIKGELADSLSSSDLIKLFYRHGNLQSDELQAFAIALTERARVMRNIDLSGEEPHTTTMPDREEAEAHYIARMMKNYSLLLTAQLHGSDRHMLNVEKIMEDMPHQLRPYRLEDEMLELLWRWHDKAHQFAEAENACYELMDRDESRIKLGVAWYERLLEHSDEELEAGGLPREEVDQALSELKGRTAKL